MEFLEMMESNASRGMATCEFTLSLRTRNWGFAGASAACRAFSAPVGGDISASGSACGSCRSPAATACWLRRSRSLRTWRPKRMLGTKSEVSLRYFCEVAYCWATRINGVTGPNEKVTKATSSRVLTSLPSDAKKKKTMHRMVSPKEAAAANDRAGLHVMTRTPRPVASGTSVASDLPASATASSSSTRASAGDASQTRPANSSTSGLCLFLRSAYDAHAAMSALSMPRAGLSTTKVA
mmetsp:Transcript_27148/g.76695  ORF Transcript_27148/g.76695 Transcript_27148/m.76695 type:complete len:238 (-) Transcript_27148:884-1597(-)